MNKKLSPPPAGEYFMWLIWVTRRFKPHLLVFFGLLLIDLVLLNFNLLLNISNYFFAIFKILFMGQGNLFLLLQLILLDLQYLLLLNKIIQKNMRKCQFRCRYILTFSMYMFFYPPIKLKQIKRIWVCCIGIYHNIHWSTDCLLIGHVCNLLQIRIHLEILLLDFQNWAAQKASSLFNHCWVDLFFEINSGQSLG